MPIFTVTIFEGKNDEKKCSNLKEVLTSFKKKTDFVLRKGFIDKQGTANKMYAKNIAQGKEVYLSVDILGCEHWSGLGNNE